MMDVPWHNELYTPEKGNRFEAVYDDGYAVYDNETRLLYHTENEDVSVKLTELMNEQQATITHLEKVDGENFAKRRLLEHDNLILRNENEQLKEELNNLKKDETMLYHYYTLARYGGDGV